MLFLHCQNFLRHKCDDKYPIFGCEKVLLEVIYFPSSSCKLSKIVGSSLAMKKESIAHFSEFLANFLGGWPKFGAQMINIEFLGDWLIPISSIYSK